VESAFCVCSTIVDPKPAAVGQRKAKKKREIYAYAPRKQYLRAAYLLVGFSQAHNYLSATPGRSPAPERTGEAPERRAGAPRRAGRRRVTVPSFCRCR
jgi:hypothetical protein